MEGFAVLVLLIVLVGSISILAFWALLRAWLDYRLKDAFLRQLEHKTSIPGDPKTMQAAINQVSGLKRHRRHNVALTGLILALLGLISTATGRYLRVGTLAVGLDLGGLICAMLGAMLTVVGLAIWYLERRAASTG